MKEKSKGYAIVTGGTSGIGKEISLFLAKQGYDLALVFKSNLERAQEISRIIQEQVPSCQVKTFSCDVASWATVQKCYSDIKTAFTSAPQVLINSAGLSRNNFVIMERPEVFEELINVNYLGTVYFCKAVVPDMIRQKYGRIINMSSVSATCHFEGHAAYAASKVAVDKFSFILGAEIAKYKVTVNVIRPGLVLTPMTEEWFQRASERLPKERIVGPLCELIQPEEVCNAIELLIRSNQITCAGIDIDGGLSKYGKA